jgi:hypothetical protein
MMKSHLAVLAAISLVSGCYSYKQSEPVDAVAPAVGSQIQVRLTQQGATSLAHQIGPEAVTLDGNVVAADQDSLRLALNSVEDSRHITTSWKGEQVSIPRDAIASVGRRKLAVGPTALLGGLAAGGVVAAAAIFSGSGESSGAVQPPTQGHQ